METQKNTVTILIPCHNEEHMIAACVDSCLAQNVPAECILVINDGSTDRSGEILKSYGDAITVLTTPTPTGNKSYVQELGLKFIKTDIFIATDGDTILDPNFVAEIKNTFLDSKIMAVSGYVKSIRHNYLTAFREIEYTIGQDIHKVAQANLNFLMVIPGCAGAFRVAMFKESIQFDHDTLTEDLDFTYKLHQMRLPIYYQRRAIVYTQDPSTLSAYINQMRRWYSGGWQNLKKHYRVNERPNIAAELSLTYIGGLVYSALFFIIPIIDFVVFVELLLINTLIYVFLGIYASIRRKRLDLLIYSPLGTLFLGINAWIFMEQFFKEIVLQNKTLIWFHPERFALNKNLL